MCTAKSCVLKEDRYFLVALFRGHLGGAKPTFPLILPAYSLWCTRFSHAAAWERCRGECLGPHSHVSLIASVAVSDPLYVLFLLFSSFRLKVCLSLPHPLSTQPLSYPPSSHSHMNTWTESHQSEMYQKLLHAGSLTSTNHSSCHLYWYLNLVQSLDPREREALLPLVENSDFQLYMYSLVQHQLSVRVIV